MSSAPISPQFGLDFLERVFDAAWVVDVDSRVVYVNPAAEALTGYRRDELVGQSLSLIMPPDQAARHHHHVESYLRRAERRSSVLNKRREFEIIDRHGRAIAVELMAFELPPVEEGRFFGALMRDIRDQRWLEECQDRLIHRMTSLALTDELTGLLNRRAFRQRLEQQEAMFARHARCSVIAVIDADRLKVINDAHGHEVGDRAIQSIASAIRDRLRAEDVVCRMGGDEFAVIFPETGLADSCSVLRDIARAIACTDLLIGESRVERLQMSCGCALLGAQLPRWRDAMRAADMALYRAKTTGRNRVVAHGMELAAPELAAAS